MLRGLNKVKQAIECPFEDEHTKFGGGGTFAVDASKLKDAELPYLNSGFVLSVPTTHALTVTLSGMLARGWLAEGDLTDPRFLCSHDNSHDHSGNLGPAHQKGPAKNPRNPREPIDYICRAEFEHLYSACHGISVNTIWMGGQPETNCRNARRRTT